MSLLILEFVVIFSIVKNQMFLTTDKLHNKQLNGEAVISRSRKDMKKFINWANTFKSIKDSL